MIRPANGSEEGVGGDERDLTRQDDRADQDQEQNILARNGEAAKV